MKILKSPEKKVKNKRRKEPGLHIVNDEECVMQDKVN